MKRMFSMILALLFMFSLGACGNGGTETDGKNAQSDSEEYSASQGQDEEADGKKILVAYFSATGTTKRIAEQLAEITGADLFEIVPETPYTSDDLNYGNDDCRANREQNDASARPAIAGQAENMEQYDVVLIGHPIWWGTEPRIIDTFMESYDFSGKTAANFCTSGGSGIAASTNNLEALAPNAEWLDGKRFSSGAGRSDIEEWVDGMGLLSENAED